MGKLRRFLKNYFIEQVELRLDATRALRAMVAFAIPLTVCHWLNRPVEAMFISMAAMNLALPDLRGEYRARLGILGTMTLVAAGSAWLGVMAAGSPMAAVLAMGAVALLGGVWRYLSADYGPAMSVSSGLLFLLGLSQPGGWVNACELAALTGLGGAFATFLHACYWMFRPQHALRYSVAETWVAAADLLAAMRPGSTADQAARSQAVTRREGELRGALDQTFVILGTAKNPKQAAFVTHLEEVRREVVHFTMRVIALNASLEAILERPEFAGCLPVMDSVLKALSDTARAAAITVIMHRAENVAAAEVRLRRCQHLITALDEQLMNIMPGDRAEVSVRAALEQVAKELPRIQKVLQETADHAVPRRFFGRELPDLSARSIQSLGAWIRPAARPDVVLIRHAVRMAVFTMMAVAIYKGFAIPRGYWIAFTIMVVLQPDYGSTRQRAGARIAGTVGGIMLVGALLWIKLPVFVLDGIATVTAFGFAYFLKRRYGAAIFFVTINLVLVTDTLAPVQHDFMVVRVLATLLGGGLALVAARVFWPVWEGEQFPALLAAAIRANRVFLLTLAAGTDGTVKGTPDPLLAKRRAENASRYVAASVERLMSEPASLRENPERAAALATYNQRVTRALTALAVQLSDGETGQFSALTPAVGKISDVLETLARVVEGGMADRAVTPLTDDLVKLEAEFAGTRTNGGDGHSLSVAATDLTWIQLAKAVAEIRAMTLALRMAPAGEAGGGAMN